MRQNPNGMRRNVAQRATGCRAERTRLPLMRRRAGWVAASAVLVVAPLLAMLSAVGLVAGSGPAAASTIKPGRRIPVVVSFDANRTYLPLKGGVVLLKGRVRYAGVCFISVSPTVKGFVKARHVVCHRGTFKDRIVIRKQSSGVLLGFTLTAKSKGGVVQSSEVAVGVGVEPPPFVFSPRELTLPTEGVGVMSAPSVVTVTNDTSKTAALGGLNLSQGQTNEDFSISSQTCASAQLPPHESCSFDLNFDPRGSGLRSTDVQLGYLTSKGQTEFVSMHIVGLASFAVVAVSGPQVTATAGSPPVVNFNQQSYQLQSEPPAQVELKNVSDVPLVIGGVSVQSGDTGDFQVLPGCSGQTIGPNQACVIGLQFTPQQTGTRSAQLEVLDNTAQGQTPLTLTGQGIYATSSLSGAGLSAAPNGGYVLQFPDTQVAKSASVTITVTNTSGAATLRFGGESLSGTNPSDFGFVTNNCIASGQAIVVGGSCTFIINFSPQVATLRTATLIISDNTADQGETITLQGTGTSAP